MSRKNEYAEKFRDPRWQEKRLRIFKRDGFLCQQCHEKGDPPTPLHVHHRYYLDWGTDPWAYPDGALVTLCETCHESETPWRAEAQRRLVQAVMANLHAEDVERVAEALETGFRLDPGGFELVELLRWVTADADRFERLLVEMWGGNRPGSSLG